VNKNFDVQTRFRSALFFNHAATIPPAAEHSRAPKRIRLSAPNGKRLSPYSCRARNDQNWNAYKEEIRRVYVDEDKTLRETMQEVGLKASERKWKEKLKEWGFQKNIPASDMAILVSKSQKRLREEGKDTIFYLKSGLEGSDLVEVKIERLESFKKRKISHILQTTSPNPSKFCCYSLNHA
jgi:Clr5 domain